MKKIKTFKNTLSYIKFTDDKIVVVDVTNAVYLFDKDFILTQAFRLKLPPNSPYENTVAADKNGKFLLVAPKGYPLTLWDLENKKLLSKFIWHKGDVLSIGICKDYFASGGIDGKVFLYSFELKAMVAKIFKHADFISALALNEEEIYAGSYDKSVIKADLSSLTKNVKKLHLDIVKKIIANEEIISVSKKSDVIKWEKERFELKDRYAAFREFADFCIGDGYLFLVCGGGIILYDIKKEILVNEAFLNFDADKIAYFNDKLYLIKNNELYEYDLVDEKELADLIIKEKYNEAYKKTVLNPFLKKTKSFQKLEKLYKASVKKALKYFMYDQKTKALEVLKPFLSVDLKKEELRKIIENFENFKKFKNAYMKKNYALFYSLAQSYPLLKKTALYTSVEKEWEIKFEKAKKMALEGKFEEVKEILKDFIPVPQKTVFIKLLLNNASIFKILKEKLVKRDFKGFFALVKQHPEIKDLKEYEYVMHYAKSLYSHAMEALKKEKYGIALKTASLLEEIPGYEEPAANIIEKARVSLKFSELMAKDKAKAFELLNKYPFLKEMQIYKTYEQKWRENLKEAQKLAFSGKISRALNLLKEYKELKKPRINSMIKSAYLNYVYKKGSREDFEKYIKHFGKDEEIERLSKIVR